MDRVDSDVLNKLLDALLARGGQYADIYYEEDDLFSFVIENNKMKAIKSGEDKGIHLRLIRGDKTYSAVASDLRPEYLLKLAADLSHTLPEVPQRSIQAVSSPLVMGTIPPITLANYAPTLDAFFKTNKQLYAASPKINQATMSYYQSRKRVVILNSQGGMVEDQRDHERYTIQVVAKDGQEVQTAYEGPGMTGGGDLFGQYPLAQMADNVVDRAILMLSAKDAPTGKMPVVLMGVAGGTMIHEACGHALEADFIYKDTSIFKGKLGQRVGTDCVTVIDDGTLPHLFGSFAYDDEGTPAQRNVLIENGILKSYMTDRLNGTLLGMPLTGNGRRESYHSKPVPRMTNTFIEDAHDDPESLLEGIEKGVLVKKMGGGQVNITNGEFIFEVSEGYLIINGKKGHAIKGASLIGNGPEVLMNIEKVANDKTFIPGICGKYDQVPVGDAQPTLKIRELVIGGK